MNPRRDRMRSCKVNGVLDRTLDAPDVDAVVVALKSRTIPAGVRTHPLTPMTDANLVCVLAAQCTGRVGLVSYGTVDRGAQGIGAKLEELRQRGSRGCAAAAHRVPRDAYRHAAARPLLLARRPGSRGCGTRLRLAPSRGAPRQPRTGGRGLQPLGSRRRRRTSSRRPRSSSCCCAVSACDCSRPSRWPTSASATRSDPAVYVVSVEFRVAEGERSGKLVAELEGVTKRYAPRRCGSWLPDHAAAMLATQAVSPRRLRLVPRRNAAKPIPTSSKVAGSGTAARIPCARISWVRADGCTISQNI